MNTRMTPILTGLLVSCGLGLGQPANPVAGARPGVSPPPRAVSEASFTRFNLDFPGGTPEQLVRAIEKASGKPVNVVIPAEYADVKLPPVRMKEATVPQLFQALTQASPKTTVVRPFGGPESYTTD